MAKLNELDPVRWLANTLDKLPTCPNSKIDSLLPFADLKPARFGCEVGPLNAYAWP